jgi:hypothetical protein
MDRISRKIDIKTEKLVDIVFEQTEVTRKLIEAQTLQAGAMLNDHERKRCRVHHDCRHVSIANYIPSVANSNSIRCKFYPLFMFISL